VFQNYALYPHMSVERNLSLALETRRIPGAEIASRVREAAKLLGLAKLLDRRPRQLSGGEQQRVALGRALVKRPRIYLMDEPLSNLDAKLRASMRSELTQLHKRLQTTFIYVTHDQIEAMTMATRIVVMKDGLIQQVDTPQNLYDFPCNVFVAGFMGTPQMNFLNGSLKKKGEDVFFCFDNYSLKLPAEKAAAPELQEYIGKEVIAGLRPELFHDEPMYLSKFEETKVNAYVEFTELMGAEINIYIKVGEETNLIARVSSRSKTKAGDTLDFAVDLSRIHIFDKDTEKVIIH
jgi:multiple sugar transport system ATP-binding protein